MNGLFPELVWDKVENGNYVCEKYGLRIAKDGYSTWYLIQSELPKSTRYTSKREAMEAAEARVSLNLVLEKANALHNDNEGRNSD